MDERKLSFKDLKILKEKKLLNENEVALKKGDFIMAENILTKERRIIQADGLILECNKKLLKG